MLSAMLAIILDCAVENVDFKNIWKKYICLQRGILWNSV